MNNPYSLVFGIEPGELVSRIQQKREVVNAFLEDQQRVFMVTGIRGSGKTVFMSEIKNFFDEMDGWVVTELSSERDMLSGLAGKLSSSDHLSQIFSKAKINLSFLGFGVEIKGTAPVTDIEVALERMLKAIKKSGKKVLIAVDEAVDNQYMREFTSVFQILLCEDLPIYLLMTGLFENIDDLQNEKNLTFLHRAPKLSLVPLNNGAMAESYRKMLGVDEPTSIKLAQTTRGYSYAFQVLGYCAWENGAVDGGVISRTKQYLEEYVYDKIWSELSAKDKKVLWGIAQASTGKIKEVREILKLESNEFAPYKKRLIRKGVISDENGYAIFLLPFFDRFVKENYIE